METGADSIAILMGCRDGARFLGSSSPRSRRRATATGGCSPATTAPPTRPAAILAAFRDAQGPERVEIRDGPRRGFAANYLGLAGDPGIGPTGTPSPTRTMSGTPTGWRAGSRPSALCRRRCRRSRRAHLLIDEAGRETGRRRHFRAAPGFANALVQSIAGGNTMLFNPAPRRLWRRCGRRR